MKRKGRTPNTKPRKRERTCVKPFNVTDLPCDLCMMVLEYCELGAAKGLIGMVEDAVRRGRLQMVFAQRALQMVLEWIGKNVARGWQGGLSTSLNACLLAAAKMAKIDPQWLWTFRNPVQIEPPWRWGAAMPTPPDAPYSTQDIRLHSEMLWGDPTAADRAPPSITLIELRLCRGPTARKQELWMSSGENKMTIGAAIGHVIQNLPRNHVPLHAHLYATAALRLINDGSMLPFDETILQISCSRR